MPPLFQEASMNKLTIIVALLSLSLPLAAQTTTHKKDGKTRTTATATINREPSKELMKNILDAWGSGNFDNVKPYYDKTPTNLYFDVLPLKYTGLEQYIDGVKKEFGSYQSVKLALTDDAQVHRSGNLAYGASIIRIDLTDKSGKSETLNARWTMVWEKKGNSWLAVHEHTSVPMPENK
jgi:ketosteroid isomerase-like protein